jgi:RNA polymerase sigma factor (TIGR02999 family)
MSAAWSDITALLGLASRGDREAQAELYVRVEAELRRRARAELRHETPTPTVQTTVLVNDAFLRLVGDPDVSWADRSEFYCCAARVMRMLLVDAARRRLAERRGGGSRPAPLDDIAEPVDRRSPDPHHLVALHEALDKLAGPYPELIQLVELHYFNGWELKQIAQDILHVPYVTVKRRWARAKALLYRELAGGDDDS